MATIDSIIQQQQANIQSAMTTAREVTSRISSSIPSLNDPSLSFTLNKPTITAPPSFGDILPGNTASSTIEFLETEVDSLIAKYFPEINACLTDTPERWLCGILTGSTPLGLSAEAFEQAWHQSRDRAYSASRSEVNQIASQFSAAGFTLPTGAMLAAVAQAEQRATDAIAEVNRAQTIRDIELKWEMLRFAEETAIQYKTGIMQLVADYYQKFLDVSNRDLEILRVKSQAYAAMQSTLSSYYQVELGFETLRFQAAAAKAGVDVDVDRNRVSANNSGAPAALAQAVRGFTDAAAASANAQSALIADLNG